MRGRGSWRSARVRRGTPKALGAGCAGAAASCRRRRNNSGERCGAQGRSRGGRPGPPSFIEGLLSTRIPAALGDEALSLWGGETRIGVVARDFGGKRTPVGFRTLRSAPDTCFVNILGGEGFTSLFGLLQSEELREDDPGT
jgi:hypothetical protein